MCRYIISHFILCNVLFFTGAYATTAPVNFIEQAQNPFDTVSDDMLPDLGLAPETDAMAQKIAVMAKAFGEASQVNSALDTAERARLFAFHQLRDAISERVEDQAETLLSSWGNASFTVNVDEHGNWEGSGGSLFTPWQDNHLYLTWTQLGFIQRNGGLESNLGIGQRWIIDNWLLGYNTFYDTQMSNNLSRAGFGAEIWGEYLRVSANYYHPLTSWQSNQQTLSQRPARGYDITAQAWLPFYQHIFTNISVEQYFGPGIDLFNNGTGYRNPMAVTMGLNYTPVPLITLTAQHKQGASGMMQENLGLKFNYRFGTPLVKQLSSAEVAASRSLRGSRYDSVERNNVAVVEFRSLKTLSAFLATPPWDLQAGETVMLKLQLRARNEIKQITWLGDTQILSLTPPANNRAADGWSVIIPAWVEGEENAYRLSATIEDVKGQKVTSNWITLKLSAPLLINPTEDTRYNLLPDKIGSY